MVGREKLFSCSALVCLLALSACLSGCPQAEEAISKAVKPPEVRIEDVAISGLSRDKLDLDLGVSIDNPNPIALSLSGVEYALSLAGKQLASGKSGAGVELKASGVSRTRVPVSLDYNNVKAIYDAASGKDEIPYMVQGRVLVKTPVGDIPIPFKTEGMLPVVRPPSIVAVNTRINDLSLSGADLALIIKVQNPNSFNLDVRGIDYNLTLDGRQFSAGHIEATNIKAKSTGKIEVPLKLDFKTAGDWAYQILTSGSGDYVLTYKGTYMIKGNKVEHNEEEKGQLKFKW